MNKRPTGRPPGPAAHPPEMRLLLGNKHKPNAPLGTARPEGVPPYPPTLKANGKRTWDNYWHYGAAWLAYTDLESMTKLCELHDEEAAIRRVLAKEGWFVRSEETGRSYQHALVNTLRGVQSRMMPLWIELHMTPSSRGRANVSARSVDPLDKWEKSK
jgi:P27 family predicted phage terminase small subunit